MSAVRLSDIEPRFTCWACGHRGADVRPAWTTVPPVPETQELTGWDRQFHDPIPLPDGAALRTLRDAGEYIANLPKAEHNAPAWRAATEALLLAVAHGGDTTLARIGIIKALHGSRPELPPTPRRKRTYRVVR